MAKWGIYSLMIILSILLIQVFQPLQIPSHLKDISQQQNFNNTDNVRSSNQLIPESMQMVLSEASNISVSYVDHHYGDTDGIIDPQEYSLNFSDSDTQVRLCFEHNDSHLFVGLEGPTTGWIGIAWKQHTENFTIDGLNRSDIIRGYAPGTTHTDIMRTKGSDIIEISYIVRFRNGSEFGAGKFPTIENNEPIDDLNVLTKYKEQLYGMRIGETRNFMIDAEDAYSMSDHPFYGEDLEYTITLEAINREGIIYNESPSELSDVEFSDDYGNDTLNFKQDGDMTRIVSVNASDDGSKTQIEFIIEMLSLDDEDISILRDTSKGVPFIVLMSDSEDLEAQPTYHTDWNNFHPLVFQSNEQPITTILHPETDEWDGIVQLNISTYDNSFVRSVACSFDHTLNYDEWIQLSYDSFTDIWTTMIDTTQMDLNCHQIYIDAWDPSGVNGRISPVIYVVDYTAPFINNPPDVSFSEIDTNKEIEWNPSDHRPVSYIISKNESTYEQGTWDGSSISIILDDISIGTYDFTLTVFDEAGNNNSDSVIVTIYQFVIETTDTNTTTGSTKEFDPLVISYIVTAVSFGVIVLVVGLLVKGRKDTNYSS